jgi:hypothetical protein
MKKLLNKENNNKKNKVVITIIKANLNNLPMTIKENHF